MTCLNLFLWLMTGITFTAIRKVLKKASDRDGMTVKTMAGFMGPNYQQRFLSTMVLQQHGRTFFKRRPDLKLGEKAIRYFKYVVTISALFSPYAILVDRKQLKLLETLTGLIQTFPLEDPQHSSFEENMEQIRAKFRQVCSLLHISTDFYGYINNPGQLSF